jgi:hypothetical protein
MSIFKAVISTVAYFILTCVAIAIGIGLEGNPNWVIAMVFAFLFIVLSVYNFLKIFYFMVMAILGKTKVKNV